MSLNEFPRSHGSLSGLTGTDHHAQYVLMVTGTAAARPTSPWRAGRVYYATDTGVISWDQGAGWVDFNPLTQVTVPFHFGGQVPVAIGKPKYIATRNITITAARYYVEAGTMTPAIYVNGVNIVQGGSIGAGPVGGLWSFTAFNLVPGDRVQLGATAADASAAEFSVTLLGTT